jgi:hypothetical protein
VTEPLVEWLKAQLDADEQQARSVPGPAWERRVIRFDSGSICEEYIAVADPDRNEVVLSDVDGMVLPFVVQWDPERVLAEVDAKRRIIGNHKADDKGCCRTCAHWTSDWLDGYKEDRLAYEGVRAPCLTLRLLALPYADRPGYDESWKP